MPSPHLAWVGSRLEGKPRWPRRPTHGRGARARRSRKILNLQPMINTTPCQMARRRHFLCWAGLKVFGKPPNLRVAERLELRGNAFLNILDRQPRRIALVFGLVLIVGIGVVDVLTGPELSFSIFYLLPVFLTTLVAGRPRSEERRVGKECRSRWSPEQ